MKNHKLDEAAFVYVMEADGRVKIGITATPEKRLRGVQTASGLAVAMLHSRKFSSWLSARKAEAGLHRKFTRWRGHGEWFAIKAESAIAAVDAALDANLHTDEWHQDMPSEILAGSALDRWRWRREHNVTKGVRYPLSAKDAQNPMILGGFAVK